MLKFACYREGGGHQPPDLRGAHLVGIDEVPVRGELRASGNIIACESRSPEPLGISVLWPVRDYGTVQLQTTRLPTREEPYHLHIELVRHRLMRISMKREEWGLFDYPGVEEIAAKIDQARDRFLEALQRTDNPPAAARLADRALSLAVLASEELCRFHAAVFIARRRQAGGYARDFLGVSVPPAAPPRTLTKRFSEVFDFVQVPFVWREIQPDEQRIRYDATDKWVTRCVKAGLSVRGGPLLNFGVQFVPDWLHVRENDYEAIADFAREHVRRTVQRYAGRIGTWIVASGLHADNVFSFSFEQVIDLTRLAASITRQAAPQARVVLDLTQPWGEYFARNERTAPPLLYAEMAVQSGISFDAFGLQFVFGLDSEGFHLRDMLQISSLIDRFAALGKPLHVTAVAVPSDDAAAGVSDRPWSESFQAAWLADFSAIALSKPYVEDICLQTLTDGVCSGVPFGGVLRADLTPKPAFERLAELRRELVPEGWQ
ncbi:MAG: endo-1,4-beta-xylanase [Phycisphaerae bacterium]